MDNRIEPRAPWVPWVITSITLVVVAIVFYSLGVNREVVNVAGEPARVWHGHGFPGIFFLFLFFWVFGGLRWIWWGSRYRPYGPWHYGGYRGFYDADRTDWEEWHRRAHERMDSRGRREPPVATGEQGPIA